MRDPLCSHATPYEILGLDQEATSADINEAFKRGLVKRHNVQKLTQARRTLENQAERALLDLFLYDPSSLSALDPDPGIDPASLELPRRQATAESWISRLRADFPNPSIVHALGVLWYWWAVHESERSAQDNNGNGASPVRQLWEWAIACWTMTLTSPDFWRTRGTIPAPVVAEVKKAAIEKLRTEISRCRRTLSDHGRAEIAAQFEQLELAFTTELRSAKTLLDAKVTAGRRALCCGMLMLERMDLLEEIRSQVASLLGRQPDNESLRALQNDLSPFAHLIALIEHNQPDRALKEIEALPPDQREAHELRQIEGRVWFERGRQLASLKKLEEALDCWRKALQCSAGEQAQAVVDETESACLGHAASIQGRQRDEALRILERGLDVVQESDKLSLAIADLLTARGVETVVEAQKKVESEGPSKAVVAAAKRGLADLERAETLGSKRAAEQAEAVRAFLGAIEGNVKIQASMEAANKAASKEQWNAAIRHLREVLQQLGPDAPEEIRKNLAICLANRGIQSANQAGAIMSERASSRDQLLSALTAKLRAKAANEHECGNCGKSRWVSSSDPWFDFKLPDGLTATLCKDCAASIRSKLEAPPEVPADAVRLIRSGLQDLREAASLDPSSAYIRKNLADIEQLAEHVGEAGVKRARASSPGPAYTAGGSPEPRTIVHSLAVGLAVVLIASAGVLGSPDHAGSLPGRIAAWISLLVGWPVLLAVLSNNWEYVVKVICSQRWQSKGLFAKLVEVLIWMWVVLFPVGLLSRDAPTPEPASSQEARIEVTKKAAGNAPKEPAIPAAASPTGTKAARRATPTPLPTPTVRRRVAQAATPVPRPPAPPKVEHTWGWLSEGAPPAERVTTELQRLQSLPTRQLGHEIAKLRDLGLDPTAPGHDTATLLLAAAEERVGNRAMARSEYDKLLGAEPPYSTTATSRISALDPPTAEDLETAHQEALERPSEEAWFLVDGDKWQWTTSHRAALSGIAEARKRRLSIRIFDWLRSRSKLPQPYQYLSVLLALGLIAKIVELPFHIGAARLSLAASRLAPQIEQIKRQHQSNPAAMNAAMVELYKRHGVKPSAGCVRLVVDLAFVIWVLLTFRGWSPQMKLDGARFLWVTDIAARDLGILVIWMLVGLVVFAIQPKVGGNAGAMFVASFGGLAVVAVLAWFMSWPAYVMVFWILLTVLGALINSVLVRVLAAPK